ncbi:MAG: hypothetical protein HY329_18300, partial [Chloroflexi bacterium]|nr:hypothetical protein [Chloroflexota bacterium]
MDGAADRSPFVAAAANQPATAAAARYSPDHSEGTGQPPLGWPAQSEPPTRPDWRRYVVGPTSRVVEPKRIQATDPNEGRVVDAEALLVADGKTATIERRSGASPAVVVDFGQVVSGKVEVTITGATAERLGLAFSEALVFAKIGSDTTDYGYGDLAVKIDATPLPATWTTAYRRTFRYLVLYLPDRGRVTIDAV